MQTQTLKRLLTVSDIHTILEALGAEKIKTHTDYTSATRGIGHDNPSGIVIYHDNFSAIMPTTPEFSTYQVADIISVVQYLQDLSFPQAIAWICQTLGFDYYSEQPKTNPCLKWLDDMTLGTKKNQSHNETILPLQTLDQFFPILHKQWFDEGVSTEVARKFHIGYDVFTNSITIPLFDEIGSLIGVQCRSLDENAESKYWFLYPCSKQSILYGFYQNYNSIKEKHEVIIFEGAKSVLQAASLGITNTVALLGKKLSQPQIDILNREGVAIVLALDQDLTTTEIKDTNLSINNPIKFNDIYLLRDDLGIYLSPKQSPADNPEMLKSYKELIYPL